MNTVVLPFPHLQPPSSEVAQYVRIGGSHRIVGALFSTGHLPAKRVVVEASRAARQLDRLRVLRNDGMEIVLDTEAAELSSLYRFQTHARHAEWLPEPPARPLRPVDFDQSRIEAIARLAVKLDVDTVLAPTYYLSGTGFSDWLQTDLRNCERLRIALDREGGSRIAIDYTIIIRSQDLATSECQSKLMAALSDLPIDQVWVRLSGLQKDAGPQKTRDLIRLLSGFHNLGRPIVLDYCAGINAQAAVAFGVASGVSYGIMEKHQFDASNWHKPMPERDPDDPSGRPTYIEVPGLCRSFKRKEFELLAQAKGGRRVMLQSNDFSAANIEEIVRDPKAAAASDVTRSFAALERVPDLNRANHFVDSTLRNMERKARDVSLLRPAQSAADSAGVDLTSLLQRTHNHHETLSKVSKALERLHDERGQTAPRVRSCRRHGTTLVATRLDRNRPL